MKKLIAMAFILSITVTTITTACPLWECQYPVDYYGCGCQGSGCYSEYNECSQAQPIYCQYCGHEEWDCVCDRDYSQNCDGYENYADCSYSGSSSCQGGAYMQHWANIRDCYGNIVGQAGCGDYVGIIGEDYDTGRVIICHYDSGIQGSVLAECVYGGYQWDGSGDNGCYNSYQGDSCSSWDNEYTECSYSEPSCSGGGYSYGSGYNCVSYTEMISIFRQYMACGGYSIGMGGCW